MFCTDGGIAETVGIMGDKNAVKGYLWCLEVPIKMSR